jgi:hypothetical protein
VSVDVWVGAVTTLAGGLLGGAISFLLSRQQIKDAERQRNEAASRERTRRSEDRRFTAYADFFSLARSYRNGIRPLSRPAENELNVERLNDTAARTDAASSLVFLVVEDQGTYDACRDVVLAIAACQELVRNPAARRDVTLGREANEQVARALRQFQAAARDELAVQGVERSRIVARYESSPGETALPTAEAP